MAMPHFHILAVALSGAALLWGVPAVGADAQMQLVMVEQPGCVYCQAWDREIAPKYALTDEGKAAPLRRIQLHAPVPDGLHLDRPATFTPTFILVQDGSELARIEGYPGEDFFWGLLAQMIADGTAAPAPD